MNIVSVSDIVLYDMEHDIMQGYETSNSLFIMYRYFVIRDGHRVWYQPDMSSVDMELALISCGFYAF